MNLDQYGPITSHPVYGDPQEYAKHLVTRSRSSFALGMRSLSKTRREAIYAVYAFCRVVDDIADEPGDTIHKKQLLQDWRMEIDALYEGSPSSLIGKALAQPVRLFDIPKQEFCLMIDGMEQDVDGPVNNLDTKALLGYTRRVAGTAGMMSIRVFGVADIAARDRFALNLADAFQLTNILRDIEEDAKLGRLYLPIDILEKHGIETNDPLKISTHAKLRDVCRDIGFIARARFNEARRALDDLNGQPLRPALMMMGVYEGYLDQMEAADFVRNPTLNKMSKWRKLYRGLRYAFAFPKRRLPDDQKPVPPLANVDHS